MDPATAAALASMMQGIIGTKQLGAPAPAIQPGGGQTAPLLGGGLLGGTQVGGGQMGGAPTSIIKPGAPTDPIGDSMKSLDMPAKNVPQASKPGMVDEVMGGAEPPGFLGGFMNNLDANLQTPAGLLGLGLLNRQDPRLAGAGLIGMGLLGRR